MTNEGILDSLANERWFDDGYLIGLIWLDQRYVHVKNADGHIIPIIESVRIDNERWRAVEYDHANRRTLMRRQA